MSTGSLRAVLLHGLYDAHTDPFADLLTIEQELIGLGFATLRFAWPSDFNPVRALIDPRRSFSSLLATELDAYLRLELAGSTEHQTWIVVAHSGGGLLWYRWLLDFAPAFFLDVAPAPRLVVTIAAPYQCRLQRIQLPDGRIVPVREPDHDPAALADASAGRLVVIAADNDQTILNHDSLFPPDLVQQRKVLQYRVRSTGHRDVCHHAETLRLLTHHVHILSGHTP